MGAFFPGWCRSVRKLPSLLLLFINAQAAPCPAQPLKIGANLSLSGKLAFIGQAQLQGLELAVAEINESGGAAGRKFELAVEDNAGEPRQAVGAMKKLLELDKVDLVFSSLTHIVQAIKDSVRQKGKIMIYGAAVDSVARDNDFFFRDWGDGLQQGAALARAVAGQGKKSVALLGEDNDAVYIVRSGFRAEAAKLNISIGDERFYSPGETDFRTILLRLAAGKPEALVLLAWRDGALLMTQLKALGLMRMQTFHVLAPLVPVNDSPEVRRLYEENGAVSVWQGYVADDPTPGQRSFAERFYAKFGAAPRAESLFAYDDMQIAAAALRLCRVQVEIDARCVARELSGIRHKGVDYELYFGPQRLGRRPEIMIQVLKGKWRRMGPQAH